MLVDGLLADGWQVHFTTRKTDTMSEMLSTHGEPTAEGRLHGYICDVRDATSIETFWSDFGSSAAEPCRLLVNNAGATWGEPAAEMGLPAWERAVGTNLTGTFLMSQRAFNERQSAGRLKGLAIVNISSIAAIRVNPRMQVAGYAASKAGLLGLTRQLAYEWARAGVTVNAILPGPFETRMMAAHLEQHRKAVEESIPVGRLGKPEDICNAVRYLADAPWMTGQSLVLDGGSSLA